MTTPAIQRSAVKTKTCDTAKSAKTTAIDQLELNAMSPTKCAGNFETDE